VVQLLVSAVRVVTHVEFLESGIVRSDEFSIVPSLPGFCCTRGEADVDAEPDWVCHYEGAMYRRSLVEL
jgi:hypothetical protein